LLGNAVKFTDQGQITLRVAARDEMADMVGFRLRFEVADTGVGIATAQLEKIFQPFEQTGETVRRAEGTGLGLAISRRLVQAMGGELQVTSVLGQGSTFSFEAEFPVVAAPALRELAPEHSIVGYTGERRKVLVVDDKAYNRTILLDMLGPLGFDLAEAADGQEAIEKARVFHPDLIMMDLVMPVMTGIEATQKIRGLSDLPPMTIIAASASAFDSDKQQSHLAGCDEFLSKPIEMARLLPLLEQHLHLHWVYDDAPPSEEPEASTVPTTLPPREALEALYELALHGNMVGVQAYADELETLSDDYKPFAAQIREMARAFDDNRLLALLETHL
jgi:CheY-like chemotaxis protein